MNADDALSLDNQLCFALYGLSRKMTALYRPLLKPLGLTYPQYLVMLVMWEGQAGHLTDLYEGVPMKRLAERLLLDSGTLTPLLKRLEANGLLIRQRSGKDERKVRVVLTSGGLALKGRAAHVPLQMLCKSPVPPDKLIELQKELMGLLQSYVEIEEH
ncbi:MAG: MarR family transcriptional regulator [Pseudomonadales bacterium]|nr:MarR family transcriptional regulator [Pseudomonadales bacterium]